MPVSAAITFRMAMGSGYVAVMRGTPVTPHQHCPTKGEKSSPSLTIMATS